MNARDNTPLRAQIADRLAAGEDTAAGIAKAIGKGDTPSIVVKELNAMRTDGQVECEQRGKKKELVYWLAVPLEVAAGNVAPGSPDDRHPAIISESALPAGMRQGTRAAQIYRVLPAFGAEPIDARAIATATGCAKALIDGALWAMVKAGQCVRHTNGVPYGYTRLPPAGGDSEGGEADVKAQSAEIPPPVPPQIPPAPDAPDVPDVPDDVEHDDAMPPADAALLALANRELADRLARVAHVLRGSGLEGLKDLDDGADLQTATAALTGAYQMALADLAALRRQLINRDNAMEIMDAQVVEASEKLAPIVPGDIDTSDMGLVEIAERVAAGHADLTARLENKDDELLKQAAVVVDLRAQLETLQRDAMRGATCLSGQDRYTAAGYLVRASKRKPRTLLDKDKAREAALGAIRAGAPRAEVFALVPVGHARRGVEWRSA